MIMITITMINKATGVVSISSVESITTLTLIIVSVLTLHDPTSFYIDIMHDAYIIVSSHNNNKHIGSTLLRALAMKKPCSKL